MATMQTNDDTTQQSNAADATCCGGKSKLKSIFGKVVLVLGALVAILCLVIAAQPSDFKASRSATMAAPPAAVFAQVNDFHNWEAWSPWAKIDPNAKMTYEGPTSGEGAKVGWSGNSDVGEGSMTIVESRPNELVRIKLDFVRPMAGTSDVEFKLQPEGTDKTAVTWSMSGKNNFMAKAISLVMDCEKMVGDQYDQGLANLKRIVESASNPAS
jgi:hypothetical protein